MGQEVKDVASGCTLLLSIFTFSRNDILLVALEVTLTYFFIFG